MEGTLVNTGQEINLKRAWYGRISDTVTDSSRSSLATHIAKSHEPFSAQRRRQRRRLPHFRRRHRPNRLVVSNSVPELSELRSLPVPIDHLLIPTIASARPALASTSVVNYGPRLRLSVGTCLNPLQARERAAAYGEDSA